jgi:hypothetical protein
MVEEVAVHEGVVALGMVHGKAHVLVHVEGNDVLEGHFAGLDHADEFGIGLDGGGTGAESQDERLVGAGSLLVDLGSDIVRGPQGTVFGIVSDNDFHVVLD